MCKHVSAQFLEQESVLLVPLHLKWFAESAKREKCLNRQSTRAASATPVCSLLLSFIISLPQLISTWHAGCSRRDASGILCTSWTWPTSEDESVCFAAQFCNIEVKTLPRLLFDREKTLKLIAEPLTQSPMHRRSSKSFYLQQV